MSVTYKIGEGAFGEVSRAEVFPYGTVAIKWLKVCRPGMVTGFDVATDSFASAELRVKKVITLQGKGPCHCSRKSFLGGAPQGVVPLPFFHLLSHHTERIEL